VGRELIWADTELYVGKILWVRAGFSLSLQFHNHKDESWYVESGKATLELGDAGQGMLNTRGDRRGRLLPVPAGQPCTG